MSETPKKSHGRALAKRARANAPTQTDFEIVLRLIDAARTRAVAAVNTTLIELYWSIGEHISRKTAEEGWGKGTVEALAATIQRRFPGMTGYSAQNLWRMRQFFETYRELPKLSPLVRELSWTHNLLILGKCKRDEEREFYLPASRTRSSCKPNSTNSINWPSPKPTHWLQPRFRHSLWRNCRPRRTDDQSRNNNRRIAAPNEANADDRTRNTRPS